MGQVEPHWAETGDPAHVKKFVDRIETSKASEKNLDKVLLRLYYGRPFAVPAVDVRRPSQSLQDIESAKAAGFSLVREVIDAASALCVRMPAIKVLPVGQQFKIQRGAKLMSRYLNGVFYDNNCKALAPQLFQDAATTRMGLLKWYIDKNGKETKVKCDRLNSMWLLWDDCEGPEPQSLYYVSPASKRALMSRFPGKEMLIRDLPHWEPSTVPAVELGRWHEVDRVKVTEAWCLSSGDEKGRHLIIAGENVVLLDEKWEHNRFPIVPYRWSHGFRTWGGRPLAEILLPYQLWNNRITRVMAEASKAAVPKLLLHEQSDVNQMSERIMEVIRWRGPNPPEVHVPTTIGADLWRLREIIKAEAYEEAGVNMSIAQGTTSDNLKSAPAQRERMDIASTRLIHPTEMGEMFWRECAEVIIMLSAKAGGKLSGNAPMGSYLKNIPWEEIGIAEGDYAVEVTSSAALPLTIGGRLDFINDMMQMKDDEGRALIKAKDALRMLQVPDTESILDRETASIDLANRQVEAALWENTYLPPEPIQDLTVLVDVASKELMRALQNDSFPEDNIELCRRLIAEANLLIQQMQAPAPPSQPQVLGPGQQVFGGPQPPVPGRPGPMPGMTPPGMPPQGQSPPQQPGNELNMPMQVGAAPPVQ